MWLQRRSPKASCSCPVWRNLTRQTCWVALPWTRFTAAASGGTTSDQVRETVWRGVICVRCGSLWSPQTECPDLIHFYIYSADYKLLGILKRQFPKVPLLGLTATATSNVLKDCEKILCVQQPITITASFNRPNLYYEVVSNVLKNIKTFRNCYSHTDNLFF